MILAPYHGVTVTVDSDASHWHGGPPDSGLTTQMDRFLLGTGSPADRRPGVTAVPQVPLPGAGMATAPWLAWPDNSDQPPVSLGLLVFIVVSLNATRFAYQP